MFLTIESLGWQDAGGTLDRRHLLPRFLPAGVRGDGAVAANRYGPTVDARIGSTAWSPGFGAAALCAAFAFHSILHAAGGSVATAATNLAYPIGDLLLLSLVIGGTVLLSGRSTLPWLLLAAGISLNVIGDTANLFSSSTIFASKLGTDFNAVAWPASILLMSMSVWLKPRTFDPLAGPTRRRRGLSERRRRAALAILLFGYVRTMLLGRAVAGDGDLVVGRVFASRFRRATFGS